MKWWMSLVISGISAAVGFFAGMKFEEKRVVECLDRKLGGVETKGKGKGKKSREACKRDTDMDIRERINMLDARNYSGKWQESEDKDYAQTLNEILAEEKYAFDLDEVADQMEKVCREIEHPEDDIPPKLISEDEWDANPENYDKQDWYFYAWDETIANWEKVMPDDPDGMFGEDIIAMMSDGNWHWEDLYIKNERLETLYRIERLEGSYTDAIGVT